MATTKTTTKCLLCSRRVKQKAGPGRPRKYCNATCRRRYAYLQWKWSE